MKHFLRSLLASVCGFSRRRSAPRREDRARLHVETMEERLSPSIALTGLAAGSVPAVTNSVSGAPGTPVDPERCVHGYKWRPPHPYAWMTPGATTGTDMQPPAVPLATVAVPNTASYLVAGGNEGTTVTVVAAHFTVTPPQGPLATALFGY
jgi:hypothetical protein